MIYLLKNKDRVFNPSVAGDRIKNVFKLDTYKYELVKIGEIDLQEKIQSYATMTNYKELIEKLHSPEDIAEYYPVNINALYADISAFSSHYMENQDLFREVLTVLDTVKSKQEMPINQDTIKKEKELKENGE